MFTIRKLEALPPKTRRRKIERLLAAAEHELSCGRLPDLSLHTAMLSLLVADPGISPAARERIGSLAGSLQDRDPASLRRTLCAVRNRLLIEMGAEPSEWDFLGLDPERLDPAARRVLPIRVYLEDIRSPFNVGSIFRTAESLGAAEVLLSPDTPLPTHPKAARTARGTADVLPWRVAGLDALTGAVGVFALEVGGTQVRDFVFPRQGTVIVGSEELGVSPEALELASASGRVSIPLRGAKRSLNVSVAFGILMHAWSERLVAGD